MRDRWSIGGLLDGWTVVPAGSATPAERADALPPTLAETAVNRLLPLGSVAGGEPVHALKSMAAWLDPGIVSTPGRGPADWKSAVIRAVARGRLLVVRRQMVVPRGIWHEAARPTRVPDLRPPAEAPARWIKVRVFDEVAWAPVANVKLRLRAPGAAPRDLVTDGQGMASADGIAPGTCDLESDSDGATIDNAYVPAELGRATGGDASVGSASNAPPPATTVQSHLISVARHRIATGETLESIAADAGTTADVLAAFNWGTSDPDLLDVAYRDELGCRRRSPDGKRAIFDGADTPGIVLIPRPWSKTRLATGQVHEIRVRPLRRVALIVENEAGLRLPDVAFEAAFAGGAVRRGRVGPAGVGVAEEVPVGPFVVSYPDQDDLYAKSLAACARRGLQDHDPAPLFHLLMQPRPVIDRTRAAYDRYFNDLGGRGLIDDLYDALTDPEALAPAEALLAYAGLATRGRITILDGDDDEATG